MKIYEKHFVLCFCLEKKYFCNIFKLLIHNYQIIISVQQVFSISIRVMFQNKIC